MHFLEDYSRQTGLRIRKTLPHTQYYPLPFTKYVTLNFSSPMAAKQWDMAQEFVNIVKPKLAEQGIELLHIGDSKEVMLSNVFRVCGQTNNAQMAFLISNSLLHIGIDSYAAHLSGIFDIPTVALYSVSSPKLCRPYFGTEDKTICLEPNFPEGHTYSINPNEQPKEEEKEPAKP